MLIRFSLFVFVFISFTTFCQTLDDQFITPNGIFDEVFDRYGNKYDIKDLIIDTSVNEIGVPKQILLCSNSYFDVYFEVNSGMENTSDPIHIARRNVICQLFADLGSFINPVNNNTKVNILIKDLSFEIADPSTSGVLGLATGFYVVPVGTPGTSGIVDNQIWKTINTGVDAYVGICPPLETINGSSSNFYHGVMAFNFSNPSINWHISLNSPTQTSLFDLYSVALHEITHALGFASLIDVNGESKFGSDYPYYSRYDRFLETSSNQSLITNIGACSMYNYQFNPNLVPSVLVQNTNNCSNHIRFGGTANQYTYTPSIFSAPSSLSHFEDVCHVNSSNAPNPYPNDEYYVMSDANNPGPTYMKRFLKDEERSVLCDIGYSVNSTYGNAVNLNNHSYGSTVCPGIQVAGTNDGLNPNGTFTWDYTIGSPPIAISGITLNDFNATSFECLEVLIGNGTTNVTSGTNFTFNSNTPGIALLRYVPVSSTNIRGNITYIIVHVREDGDDCQYTTCNLIPNGGFEDAIVNCQFSMLTTDNLIQCWSTHVGTPELFGRDCNDQNVAIPTIFNNTPPADTWNGAAGMNDRFLGIFSGTTFPVSGEASQVSLSTALINNTDYVLRFWARVPNNYATPTEPTPISICASNNPIFLTGANFNSNAPGLTPVIPLIVIPNIDQWVYMEEIFTYSGPTGLDNLIIGSDPSVGPPSNSYRYVFIDDIELLPASSAATFTPPTILCSTQIIDDLNLYTSISNGTFEGNGVENNFGTFSFNPTIAGIGEHLITYNYTTSTGCELSTFASIEVVNASINLNVVASDNEVCPGETIDLIANGALNYNWQPGNFAGNQYTINPTVTTTYTVTGTSAEGCVNNESVTITVETEGALCCYTATVTLPDDSNSSSSALIPSNSIIDVLGLFTVNSNLTLASCTLRMAPDAKIEVMSGFNFTLTNCIIFSCTEMWDGIYSNSGAMVTVEGSRIEDAKNAIFSVYGGNYFLNNTTFNKNSTGIFVDYFNGTHLGIVKNCTFDCTSLNSPTLGSVLKAPMAGEKSHFGIYGHSINQITFGEVSAQPNVFQNIEIGIGLKGTKANIYRNNFNNIVEPFCSTISGPCPVIGWAIWAGRSHLLVGDNAGMSHENNITNCSNGIFLDSYCSFEIRKNNFTNILTPTFKGQYSKCIFARFGQLTSSPSYGEIEDNTFVNFESGIYYEGNKMNHFYIKRNRFGSFNSINGTAIYLRQNYSHPIEIKNNIINFLPNQKGLYGIRVQNAVQPSNDVTIEQNTIKNVRHAIWTTNYDGINISDHSADFTSIGANAAGIYYPNSLPMAFSVGIKVENCPNTNISNNLIQKAMPNPTVSYTKLLYGISVETNGMGSTIVENEVKRLGKGLNFYGQPNAPLYVSCNAMYLNRTGLSLNNTYIGNQGSSSPLIAQDNQWTIPGNVNNFWLGAERITSSPGIWYTRSSNLPFFPQGLQMSPVSTALIASNVGGAPYNCSFGCVNPPCLLVDGGKMIKKENPFNLLNNEEKQMIDIQMYKLLKNNPSYLSSGTPDDSIYVNYVDSLDNTNIGKIYRFTKQLVDGDTLASYNEILTVTPNMTAETNHKIVNEIYWRSWVHSIFEFSPADSAYLLSVAEQHPHQGGTAVYDARVMLGLDFYDYEDQQKSSNVQEEISVLNQEGEIKFILFPNPANSFINYRATLADQENAELVIYNVLGKPLLTQVFTNENLEGIIDIQEMASGLYTYRIFINKESVKSGTFIVN